MQLTQCLQKAGSTKIHMLIIALMVGLTSCTKKRDEKFGQGQGQDLIAISDLDNKLFDVETLNEIGAASQSVTIKDEVLSSRVTNVETKSKFNSWKLAPVKINTKAQLVGDVPFIARANDSTSYKVQYKVQGSSLVVYKLADKANLHPKEVPGAFKDDNSTLLAVPLVSYPIKGFFNVENAVENDEKSSKLLEMPANDKGNAKYMRIDYNGKTIYKLKEKLDVFHKDYFKGDWYYAETIIATDKQNKEMIGQTLSQYDQELNPTTKVRFSFNGREMRAMTTNVNPKLDLNDELNQNVLLKLPITWKAYRPTPKGNSFDMAEEEVESLSWDKKEFLQIAYEGLISSTVMANNFALVDLELDDNYFSFTVQENRFNVRIKYSFLKSEGRKAYTPKLHLEKDFDKFGFFTTKKAGGSMFEKYKKEDLDKNTFINRFNVADGKVTFYFTQGSDESLIPAAAEAVKEWDKAFEKAGVPLRIEADTTKRVGLGDLRYNQINLIKTVNETNLFGFGPSITDPDTGEIISAVTNMHVTTIQSALVTHIRNYLLYKSGRTKDATLFVVPPEYMPNVSVTKSASTGKDVINSTSSQNYFLKKLPIMVGNQLQMIDIEANKTDAKSMLKKSKNWGREFDMGVSGKHLNEEIETRCPELNSLVANIQKYGRDEKETDIIVACSEKVLPGKMVGTLLHELGHNFGLRHNFYASTDAINFLSTEESKTKDQVRSSSVMEYPSFSEDRLTTVGKYDIAAIRYGYADAVETVDKKILPLNTSMTINENLAKSNVKAKSFKFCTDEDVELNEDPMCARHDSGTTPLEIVKSLIQEYNTSIATYNYRFDRARGIDPARLTNYRVQRYWVGLKRYYDEWRFKLVDYLGQGNEYLENYDAKSYAAKLEQMKNDPQFSATYNLYKPAADEIFNFAMQIATLPTRYCIGERNGTMASIEFSEVRKAVYNMTKATDPKIVKSCMDAEAVAYVKQKSGFVPTTQSGYELEDVRYNMDAKAAKEPFDIIGLMPEKNIAVSVLTVRAALSQKYEENAFLPNFVDEPDNRDKLLGYLADRLSKGVSSDRLVKTKDHVFLEKFKNDKRYIENLVSSVFFDGLEVPEKEFATRKRKKKFAMKYTDKKDTLDKAIKKVLSPDGTSSYVVLEPDATEAIKLLEKLETLPARIAAAVPVTEETFSGLIELAKSELGNDEKVDYVKLLRFMHLVIDDEANPGKQNKNYSRPKDQKDNDKNRVHWKRLLPIETGLTRDLVLPMFDPSNDFAGTSEAWASFYGNVGDRLKERMAPIKKDYNINVKMIQEMATKYVEANKAKAGEAISNDIYDYDELQTQYELILSLLRRISEYN
ncbi:MAG: zinc-dependent metalloprotease [Bdellovibrio sp.]|nr:zinc-dependent metalloprotease [Bdellovibrio sp.]